MEPVTMYNGLLGLDRTRSILKWINWFMSLVFVLLMARWLLGNNTRLYVDWDFFVVLPPSFIAVAWLRLTGIRWRYALFFPVFAFCVAFVLWIGLIIYSLFTMP
jgi:hypothetical protein